MDVLRASLTVRRYLGVSVGDEVYYTNPVNHRRRKAVIRGSEFRGGTDELKRVSDEKLVGISTIHESRFRFRSDPNCSFIIGSERAYYPVDHLKISTQLYIEGEEPRFFGEGEDDNDGSWYQREV